MVQLVRKSYTSYLEVVVILLFVTYAILPSLQMTVPFQLVLILEIIYSVFVAYNAPEHRKAILYLIFCAIFISVLYVILTETRSISVSAENRFFKRLLSKCFQFFGLFFPLILLIRTNNFESRKVRLWMFLFIIGIIFFVVVNTLEELNINTHATRSFNTEVMEESYSRNAGHYAFVYCIPFVITFLTYGLTKFHKIWWKLLILAAIIFLFNFILKAQYTLSLLITLVGVISILIKDTTPFVKFVVIFFLVFFSILLPVLFDVIIASIESEDMQIRLKEMMSFFTSNDSSTDNLSGRMTLYWKSIVAFLESPLWGNRQLDFDGHATILTILSDLGILGGMTFFKMMAESKKSVTALLFNQDRGVFSIAFAMLILMGLTNPIHSSAPIAYGIWFITPLGISIINDYSKRL